MTKLILYVNECLYGKEKTTSMLTANTLIPFFYSFSNNKLHSNHNERKQNLEKKKKRFVYSLSTRNKNYMFICLENSID